ncbi:MAG: ATP-dependent helicase [Desulfonauticus sp.]|nr:ATP-dependent helicase [Desulfonauticus sp.]
MKVNYEQELNPAQLKAVTHTHGPLLVIAGAGSGKTRTIVYRLAYLVEKGVFPAEILLLTFTRKAASEMLFRAENILEQQIHGLNGGTFHSFACTMLKKFSLNLGWEEGFSVIDQSDATDIIRQAKYNLNLHKDKTFPKPHTIYDLISRSRNKELSLEQTIVNQSYHLLTFLEDIEKIADYYKKFKAKHFLLDYDDLLFFFEQLLQQDQNVRSFLQQRFSFIMVDEFQDTNKVQGRIVQLLAGPSANIMAVGDDAQSIYAFRGASVENILNFPQTFPGTTIVKLEQNYRSTQPILSFTNHILSLAQEKYPKKLFSENIQGPKPELFYTKSDLSQAQLVVKKIQELSLSYPYHEIAVLFRAGYQSYALEMELGKIGIKFQKFGGQKFSEAAHIKDIIAFLRLVTNPCDVLAWTRALGNIKGVGPKTCQKLYQCFFEANFSLLDSLCAKNQELKTMLQQLDSLRQKKLAPQDLLEEVIKIYTPIMEEKFVDDLPKRMAGLEQLLQIASIYDDVELFLADLTLETSLEDREELKDKLVLSTIHSAKGLEWDCVLIIDLVEERFPSRHALMDPKSLEEERRLLYVACTRARKYLGLFVPTNIYNRYQGNFEPRAPSPFIREVPDDLIQKYQEDHFGTLHQIDVLGPSKPPKTGQQKHDFTSTGSYCLHKIFGRGKVIAHIPPNKYKIHFPEHGLKTVLADYLEFE